MALPELTSEQKQRIKYLLDEQVRKDAAIAKDAARQVAKRSGRSLWQRIKAWLR